MPTIDTTHPASPSHLTVACNYRLVNIHYDEIYNKTITRIVINNKKANYKNKLKTKQNGLNTEYNYGGING